MKESQAHEISSLLLDFLLPILDAGLHSTERLTSCPLSTPSSSSSRGFCIACSSSTPLPPALVATGRHDWLLAAATVTPVVHVESVFVEPLLRYVAVANMPEPELDEVVR